ncbi:MAG TPA: hypothetical protein VMB91_09545 [Solirubrobacteraceae bacterium]|nr:hypothetical protein [Solirubrobacteraceae bacterium]
MAARAVASGALGAGSASYRVGARADGDFAAYNPAQRLSATFGATGVQVAAGGTTVGLQTVAAGFGASPGTLAGSSPRASSNRVSYSHPGIDEWYANGPLGLEQGFTVARPAGAGAVGRQLTIAIGVGGSDVQPVLAAGGRSVSFERAGRTVLLYGDLSATDARGRALPSSLGVEKGRIVLRVDTSRARYPLRVDPLVQNGALLEGEGEKALGGLHVALAADGDTLLITGREQGFMESGDVWVFVRSGSSWTQQGEPLKVTPELGEPFSLALSGDGNTALVGMASPSGAAWVFTRSGGTWSSGTELVPTSRVAGDYFGVSVALSGDGETALVGAPGNIYEAVTGGVWVFKRSGETWSQQGEPLTGSEDGAQSFGDAVALSGDGDTALVGADDGSGPAHAPHIGGAWVFTRSGETWSQQGGKLQGSDEVGKDIDFGSAVALSADGNTALISGPSDDDEAGAVWAFTRSGQTWSQQGPKLTGLPVEEGSFGESLALSDDGNSALIAGYEDGAELFTRSGETWSTHGEYLASTDERLERYDVALSGDAKTALLGRAVFEFEEGEAASFPHWDSNGVRLNSSRNVRVSTSGSMTLHLGGGQSVTCSTKGKGDVWNQTGGGVGLGELDGPSKEKGPPATEFKGCHATGPVCAAKEKVGVEPQSFWNTQLLAGTPIRDEILNVELDVLCVKNKVPTPVIALTGTLAPEVGVNTLVFGPGSGELEESPSGHATLTGTMKIKGKGAHDLSASAP